MAFIIEQANSQDVSESAVLTSPSQERELQNGQTIFYSQQSSIQNWYAIRATQKRARKVYDLLESLNDSSISLYFPLLKKVVYSNEDFNHPTKTIVDEPVDPNLLFMKCSHSRMLYYLYDELRPQIPGFTPYYDHCVINSYGHNDLLTIPERQMESFRIIVESGNENILLREQIEPKFLEGDTVEVTGGPFAGVTGKLIKYKHQKRVVVEINGLGCFCTAYVPREWMRKV